MAHKFSDEAKTFQGGGDGNWFGFGVHEVTIGEVTEGQTDSGTDFIEFTLLGDNEEEDTARVWLTEKSEKYSFRTLKDIYVHCAPEAKKQAARESFDAAEDSTAVVELLQNCIGKKCWFTKYPDPKRTYEASDGTIKKSINKNIYGYAPKLREDLMPQQDKVVDVDVDKPITAADLGGEDASGDAGIPEKW
jgi:hypothetical protein